MKALFRIFLALISLFLLGSAAILWFTSNMTLGLILQTAIGTFLLLYALFFDGINHLLDNSFGAWVKGVVFASLTLVFFTITLLSISASYSTVTCREDAMIVLGAGLRGDQVSQVLAYRLDAAVQYHQMNPDALIVVSGGQGDGEWISEAEAMERYLVKKGVASEVIIKEERATSTLENFKFSKDILDERLGDTYKLVYTTNRFHLYRAGRLAKDAGLSASRMPAKSAYITLVSDYLRECCAVWVMWFPFV